MKVAQCAVVLAVSACNANGGSSSAPGGAQRSAEVQSFARMQYPYGMAVAACTGSRRGMAQCDALAKPEPAGAVTGYGPQDLQAAYNLPSATKGAGQIVAIVDAYDNPHVASDLAAYRSHFSLPGANFTKYNQDGKVGNYPRGDVGWGVEIDLDAEMVSAGCPKCTIYLIEANSNAWSDLDVAEREAVRLGAHIVSNSFGGSGGSQSPFKTKGVTYLGSAGASGDADPADFPSVVAVGGTTLTRGGGGKRDWTESTWGLGDCTTYAKPPWQHDSSCAFRLANDVSAVADPTTGVAGYDTYGVSGWLEVGGTSVPAPLLAGVFGLAGNATNQDGGRTFWQKAHHEYLYRVSNGGAGRYSTGAGWGSPDGTGAF
jgi:subtilase family serine protease